MFVLRRTLPRLLILLGFALGASPAEATSPGLREELKKVASNIKRLLDGLNEESVAVGQFSGPANFPATSGPGISQSLGDELKKLGIAVKARAKFGIKGDFHPSEINAPDNPLDKLQAINLKGVVEDSFGKVINNFNFLLKNETDYTEIMGLSLSFSKEDKTPAKRADKMVKSITNPKIVTQGGTTLFGGQGSPYGIEILVNGKPQIIQNNLGLSFVGLKMQDVYEVRLINNSPHDAAVRLNIDGLNMFTFSDIRDPKTKDPVYSTVIIKANKSGVIKGWHKSNEFSDEFLITEYAKSGAGLLGHAQDVGTITATFAAAWIGDMVPSDEPPKSRDPQQATGFGKSVKAPYVVVNPTIGTIRASVSVRYSK